MRALELPPIGAIRRGTSPLPLTLAALVVVLALKAAGLGAGFLPADEAATLAGLQPAAASRAPAVEAGLPVDVTAPAPWAPAPTRVDGPRHAIGDETAETPEARAERLVADLLNPAAPLAALAPAAGPIDLLAPAASGGGGRLQAEPFLDERRELARQQEALNVRQIAMDIAEKRLRGHIAELAALRDEVEARLAELEARDEARIARLVKLYETMNPKRAAVIFDELPFEVMAPLSLAMSERKLAPVVAAMSPEVARRLTAELAKRRRDASLDAVLAAPGAP